MPSRLKQEIWIESAGRKPDEQKADRNDAGVLGQLLWVNRHRFLAGKPVQGVRRVHVPNEQDAKACQLTCLWNRMTSHLKKLEEQVGKLAVIL